MNMCEEYYLKSAKHTMTPRFLLALFRHLKALVVSEALIRLESHIHLQLAVELGFSMQIRP
jgi:hypothetical protein